MRHAIRAALIVLVAAVAAAAQEPVQYQVSFPAPEHHYAQVEVTFPAVPAGTLEARMSRSSPGRYAVHEYSKNVFDVHAYDGKGTELAPTRPNPYQWDVAGHDGTVRIAYKVYGDHIDGTYLGIDTTHAHMNLPATLMWARGFDMRPARIRFQPPAGSSWKAATQLFPTDDAWTFTAPNLQYLMDSPTELSAFSLRTFKVRNPDGKQFTIRVTVHHDATEADVDEYVAGTEKIVNEMGAVYGEFPEFDTGTYTFLADYVPWGGGDGMEHRNSTVVAAAVTLRDAQMRRRVLGTVSHEFFHAWNVERIRPKTLEPFDFEEANISGELWLAEGFTQYYGRLIMRRAGLTPLPQTVGGFGGVASEVITSPGRQFRSAVQMSEMAPFSDAARAVDPTNLSTTFLSYYTYGAAVALAMDLSLRDRSNSKVSLDDFMRAMWRVHGKPGGPQPGLVARPYTLQDARERLAEVSGDRAFADEFFTKYVEGREVADYARLFGRAGIVFRKRNAGAAWAGSVVVEGTGRITELVSWGSPAHKAGLDQGDVITAIDSTPLSSSHTWQTALKAHKPGDRMSVTVKRRDGATTTVSVTLAEDPAMEAVPVESAGGTLTAEQKAFRDAWLGARMK
ncbi:MAG: PDZ domain-containing protein [Acidobacteria bacterium]|nr:PDZ domain-containing protein [Acidobacteriota bacterium]MCA1650948.1 PDZ domain-containing protein [Acidobacteriota bacterium]